MWKSLKLSTKVIAGLFRVIRHIFAKVAVLSWLTSISWVTTHMQRRLLGFSEKLVVKQANTEVAACVGLLGL